MTEVSHLIFKTTRSTYGRARGFKRVELLDNLLITNDVETLRQVIGVGETATLQVVDGLVVERHVGLRLCLTDTVGSLGNAEEEQTEVVEHGPVGRGGTGTLDTDAKRTAHLVEHHVDAAFIKSLFEVLHGTRHAIGDIGSVGQFLVAAPPSVVEDGCRLAVVADVANGSGRAVDIERTGYLGSALQIGRQHGLVSTGPLERSRASKVMFSRIFFIIVLLF